MTYSVYILRCSDNSFYVGITTDVSRRVKQHNGLLKGGAKYTRSKRPVALCYLAQYQNRSEASRQEYALKLLTHQQKQDLCKEFTG